MSRLFFSFLIRHRNAKHLQFSSRGGDDRKMSLVWTDCTRGWKECYAWVCRANASQMTNWTERRGKRSRGGGGFSFLCCYYSYYHWILCATLMTETWSIKVPFLCLYCKESDEISRTAGCSSCYVTCSALKKANSYNSMTDWTRSWFIYTVSKSAEFGRKHTLNADTLTVLLY